MSHFLINPISIDYVVLQQISFFFTLMISLQCATFAGTNLSEELVVAIQGGLNVPC